MSLYGAKFPLQNGGRNLNLLEKYHLIKSLLLFDRCVPLALFPQFFQISLRRRSFLYYNKLQ